MPAPHQDARGLHSAPRASPLRWAGRPVRLPGRSCGVHVPSLRPLPPLGYASAVTLEVRHPPLCPALASQAAEKRLGLRRPEGQLKDMTGGGRAGQSSGPSCHLCGCAQGWDSDHWASVGMWPSQYQAVWAVGQGAPWEGRWEGWHVGLESPRPGQPWLCRVSSWPSGQVTKSLGMSAFGTCV